MQEDKRSDIEKIIHDLTPPISTIEELASIIIDINKNNDQNNNHSDSISDGLKQIHELSTTVILYLKKLEKNKN